MPWPLAGKPEPSENSPKEMHRFWIQAHDSLANQNWDAAAVMSRSRAVLSNLSCVTRGAKKGNLKDPGSRTPTCLAACMQAAVPRRHSKLNEVAFTFSHPRYPEHNPHHFG